MDSSKYVEWSAKTNYSFLRAGSSPAEIARTAAELGISALAVTDLHGVYGMPKIWGAFRELENSPKLLVGAEIPIARVRGEFSSPNVSLVAKNRRAYGALCRMLTEAHRHCEKGRSELLLPEFLSLLEELPGAEDLIVFPQWEDFWETKWANGSTGYGRANLDETVRRIAEASAWIGELNPKNVFLPLSRRLDGLDTERTAIADALARIYGTEIIAHNRVLYHAPERRRVQDTLACIREGKTFREAGYLLRRNEEAYLKSPATMAALFRDRPELIARGISLAEECVFLPTELRYVYPSEWIPEGMTGQAYLESLCWKGVSERYPEGMSDRVAHQLRHELGLIAQLGYADYFLTVYDIVDFAKRERILCQGRGSAANSIVCYVLGVTAIDPIQMDFLFERFISAERGEPPDIDIDFEHERREEVLQYVYTKYGRDRAAMVSAVITYRSRSALREAAKAFGIEVGTLSARKVEKLLLDPEKVEPKLAARVCAIAEEMEDFPRHLSIHSGGFTLSAEPIVEIVPVEPASMEGRTIIQWDKYDLDILGLLKIDLLSLGMLTALRRGLDLVGKELYEIKPTDPATYAMIQRADTIGTFQIESRAQMAMLPRLKPANFYELVVEVAIVRPGPIVGKMVHPYLKRKRGEPYTLPHPALKKILGRTHGVPIFQEQVMKMAIDIAGFTPGEADRLRRAIGAWRSSGSIDVMGRKLKEGLMRAKIPEDFSQRIFDQIHGFAEYGFPESHAASFALLAYASCWLKCHHPAEFLVAMLNSQPLGFYAPHTLVDDAKRHGVEVRPISILRSDWHSKLEFDADGKKSVRVGFHLVGGFGEKEWNAIASARTERPFAGYQDFFVRTKDKLGGAGIRRRALRALALGDVFRDFGLNQREALWRTLETDALSQASLFHREEVQSELFSAPSMSAMGAYEAILSDYRSTGMSVRGHPMTCIRERMRGAKYGKLAEMNSRRARECPNGRKISIPGLSLILQRPPTANGTAFATLEDEYGLLDLVLRAEVFPRVRAVMHEEPFVIVTGVLQRDGGAASLVVSEVRPFLSEPDPEGVELVAKFETMPGAVGEVRFPDSRGSIARRY
jgi:error-prone DNA polymerase